MELLVPALVLLIAGAAWLWRGSRRVGSPALVASPVVAETDVARESKADHIPYTTDAIEAVRDDCFKLAFGVTKFGYQLVGEHADVFERANERLQQFRPEQSHFPRRPMLLPRLLQAMNSEDSTRAELTHMILQDPALAGSVLERANAAAYRTSSKPVESVDRALARLGIDGLRSIVASFILQPLFRLPTGYFERFAPLTWQQGQRAGYAAQVLAQRTGAGDPLVAQLLAMLSPLSRIVLFRFTSDCYREVPQVLPRADVFIRVMRSHCSNLCATIAEEWALSPASRAALAEQARRISPEEMQPLGRALYFADLIGALALVTTENRCSEAGALAILSAQGLSEYDRQAAWQAALSVMTRPES